MCDKKYKCDKNFTCCKIVDGKLIYCKNKYNKDYSVAFERHYAEVKNNYSNIAKLIELRKEKMKVEEKIHSVETMPIISSISAVLAIGSLVISIIALSIKICDIQKNFIESNVFRYYILIATIVVVLLLLENVNRRKCRCLIARRDAINDLILEYETEKEEKKQKEIKLAEQEFRLQTIKAIEKKDDTKEPQEEEKNKDKVHKITKWRRRKVYNIRIV